MQWFMLLLAVGSNAVANIAFKRAVIDASKEASRLSLLLEPWFWTGAGASALLLISYLLALRNIELDVAYAVVTTGSLLILAAATPILFHGELTLTKITGMALAVSGILMLVYSQIET